MERRKFLQVAGLSAYACSLSGFTFVNEETGNIDGCPTTRDMLGPFYKKDAPFRNIINADSTDRLSIKVTGKVISCQTQAPLANTLIDIWHCDDRKNYDEEGYQCRGRFYTDESGFYWFKTFIPPPYGGRPKHIHFLVNKQEGYKELVTQLYFKGDRRIKLKNWVKYPWDQKRILEIKQNEQNESEVNLDLYLEAD